MADTLQPASADPGEIPDHACTRYLDGAGTRLDAETEFAPTPSATDRIVADLGELLVADPVLRLYLAVGTAFPDSPWPPHPAHPGGTLAVGLDAVPWDQAIAHRCLSGEPADSRTTEHVATPLVRVFRTLVDRYGIVLADPTLAAELSSELAFTGRFVIRNPAGIVALTRTPDCAAADRALVARGVRALCRQLNRLVRVSSPADCAATRIPRPTAGSATDSPSAGLDPMLAAEFRFLRPATEKLLHGTEFERYAHSVTREQDEVLREVLRRVAERDVARRRNPRLSPATVLIDLDLCAIVPRERTLVAARQIAGARPGAPDGIVELEAPERLRLLPTYSPAGWEHFLDHTGLRQRYPVVDWSAVRTEFHRACFLPWERLRSDTLAPGLTRFVRAVERNGGEVVFNTARRDLTRAHTGHVLAQGGLLTQRLLTTPDSHQRSAHELKVENVQALSDPYVVAIFDDLAENRAALRVAAPDAVGVAVELPGFTSDRPVAARPRDGAAVVAGFEMLPGPTAPVGEPPVPALSQLRAVDRLALADLTAHPVATEHGVMLSEAETSTLIDQLISVAEREADIAVQSARRNLYDQLRDVGDGPMRTVVELHHMLTRNQFCRGPRSTYPLAAAVHDMTPFVTSGAPISLVLPALPIKQCRSRLKAVGPLPDLAELGFLIRLLELRHALRQIHEPGVRIHILTDGQHFQRNSTAQIDAYGQHVHRYLQLVGLTDVVHLGDIDDMAAKRLGPRIPEQRETVEARYRSELWSAFAELDFAADPVGTLDRVAAADPSRRWHALGTVNLGVRSVFTSALHMVATEAPSGVDQRRWSAQVLSDVHNLTDPQASPELLSGRKDLLHRAFEAAIDYVAAAATDRELGYEEMFNPRVRLTVNIPSPGRCGFAGLGGSELLPWQGTAAVDHKGLLATDFIVSLENEGFLPVYSPLLGAHQPWFMAPTPVVHVRDRARGAELDPSFAATIRLRRR